MTPEQRQRLIEILLSGGELEPEWARIMFPPEKREYELVYHGKEREEDIIANTLAVPLQPVRTFNKSSVEWHNKLIFGDNLQAMKTLLEMKRRGELCNADGTPGIRLVYIDPPFATKREFNGNQGERAYQDKIAGAQFVEFLRKRLVLLRELLSDDGVIFVHLDTKKSHYAKVILDEIFGESNFRNEIIWKRQSAHNDSKQCGAIHDSIFMYTKSSAWIWNEILTPPSSDYIEQFFDQVEPKTGRRYARGDLTAGGLSGGGYDYEYKGVKRIWRCPLSTMEKHDAQGKLHWPKKGVPRLKRYQDEFEGVPLQDIWLDVKVIHNQSSERTGYPTQKPETLVERIILACSNQGDLVMDTFAGSGTTCAVAEKLGRHWIAIDCGKLAIYTIQKRLLNLKINIGYKGASHKAAPFTLYNAGLYDFARLKDLPWPEWRRFALTLFGCQDEPQRIGGIQFDGTLKACPVQVFDHRHQVGATISEDTLRSMHEAVGSKIGTRMFIIAPSLIFDFQQDYIQIGEVRYYALRIPYSIIHELHKREFMALKQPVDEMAVNDTVDAVGFDFIKTPDLEYALGRSTADGELLEGAFIRINSFYSEAAVREPMEKLGNRETLSMVMLDYNYDAVADVFDLDEVFYAGAIAAADWEVRFSHHQLGEKLMAVFVDIYGNEARVVIPSADFSPAKPVKAARAKTAPKKAAPKIAMKAAAKTKKKVV